MNKQEIENAIQVLKQADRNPNYYVSSCGCYATSENISFDSSLSKAIEIAISGLEQQLNNGWIPEAMKEILTEDIAKLLLNDRDEFNKWMERGIWNCKRLNELSNRNNGWIPVSRELPSSGKCLRVCVTLRRKETEYIFTDRMRWFFGKFIWFNGSKLSDKYEVLAWMVDITPEPYTEESK